MAARVESFKATYRRWSGHWPWLLVGGLVVAALALWLWVALVPVAPTSRAPASAPEVQAPLTGQDLNRALARWGVRPEGSLPEVEALLATPQYYAVTGRKALYEPAGGPSLVFFLSEDTHEELPPVLEPVLRIDGQIDVVPVNVGVLADSSHHRMTVVRFPASSPEGTALVSAQTGLLELFLGSTEGAVPQTSVLSWELPIAYSNEYSSAQVVVGDSGPGPGLPLAAGSVGWTWAAILAMLAGMLVALSPCLVQLGAYFTATLASVSAESSSPESRARAQRHIVNSALFFVLGFTMVYTAGGAAAGYVGQSLQSLGLLSRWVRPLSIAAGLVILLLAARVAWN
ncbi:MAG: hypothetical protein HYY01_01520, partial [Chloroflexi bacterium]|nr:hypothetical protein [Chloroflexota bacterium]